MKERKKKLLLKSEYYLIISRIINNDTSKIHINKLEENTGIKKKQLESKIRSLKKYKFIKTSGNTKLCQYFVSKTALALFFMNNYVPTRVKNCILEYKTNTYNKFLKNLEMIIQFKFKKNEHKNLDDFFTDTYHELVIGALKWASTH